MTITLDGSNGITTPMYNGAVTSNQVTPSVNMKNRIINGAMVISQRNGTNTVTPANADYTLDRWQANLTASSKFSVAQGNPTVGTAGNNAYSLNVTSLSSYSVGASDQFNILQKIEGYNIADLGWGSASAKAITISAWVYSSLTGTFSGSITNSALNRCYVFNYTVSSANTWTQISVTIPGDTSGTWLTTNGIGMFVIFGLGSGSTYSGTAGSWGSTYYTQSTGSVSVVGTNGATFYITGVQLEVGSSATSFDYRQYGTELALCQRYLPAFNYSGNAQQWSVCLGINYNTGTAFATMYFPVSTRVPPTGISVSTSSATFTYYPSGSSYAPTLAFSDAGVLSGEMSLASSGYTVGYGGPLRYNASSSSATAQILWTGCEL